MDTPRFKLVTEDLMGVWDTTQFDHIGPPRRQWQDTVTAADNPTVKEKPRYTLTDLAIDHEFFTTGVILAATPFDRDPVSEFVQLHPAPVPEAGPMAIDANKPFFRGLGRRGCTDGFVDFDRRLYFIHRDRWEGLRDMIAGIGMFSPEKHFFGRVNFYELKLPDILATETLVTRTVPVTVFGVNTTRSFAYLDWRKGRCTLIEEDPREDIKVESQAWL